MKTAVIGSRTITSPKQVTDQIENLQITELISGGADGVDTIAEKWAKLAGIKTTIIKPDYERYGKQATLIRNKEIIDRADMVIAIWDGKSKGTLHAIEYAKKTGKKISLKNTAQSDQMSLW
jgi:hypothetical protein